MSFCALYKVGSDCKSSIGLTIVLYIAVNLILNNVTCLYKLFTNIICFVLTYINVAITKHPCDIIINVNYFKTSFLVYIL